MVVVGVVVVVVVIVVVVVVVVVVEKTKGWETKKRKQWKEIGKRGKKIK